MGLTSFVQARWKSILIASIIATTAFSFGAYANQVRIIGVQPLAGSHVLVPNPNLVINGVYWQINATTQMLTGLVLNVTAPNGSTSLYDVIVSVSCVNLANGTVFWCAHGEGKVQFGSATTGNNGLMTVTLTPQFDPEDVEVHDLSFIVTALPTVPAPVLCSPTAVCQP